MFSRRGFLPFRPASLRIISCAKFSSTIPTDVGFRRWRSRVSFQRCSRGALPADMSSDDRKTFVLRRQLFRAVTAPRNPKKPCLTSGPTLVTLCPMGTHAFGFRPPANAPDGQKRFPISGALCSERGIDVCVIEYLRNSHFLNDPAVFAAALGQ